MFFAIKKIELCILAICKLCIHKSIYVVELRNLNKVLKEHLNSQEHKHRFTKFTKEPWRFPLFLTSPLTYQQYQQLIDQSSKREGKIQLFDY